MRLSPLVIITIHLFGNKEEAIDSTHQLSPHQSLLLHQGDQEKSTEDTRRVTLSQAPGYPGLRLHAFPSSIFSHPSV